VLTELTPIESSLEDVFRDLTETPETPSDTKTSSDTPAETTTGEV